jgi:integrase
LQWVAAGAALVAKSGYPIEPRNLARSFERIVSHAGLRPIRLHDLRHTTATLLKDLGVSVRDTMEILGHSRIAVTLEIYTGADDASRREAIERLNRLFGRRSG